MHSLAEVKGFGTQLIETEDLDPVYCALYNAFLPDAQLKRLLVAYFLFYSLGGAARLSEAEGKDFWYEMKLAAANTQPIDGQPTERFPRGAERRHFRGQKCIDAVNWFAHQAPKRPECLIDELTRAKNRRNSLPARVVMERVQEWPMCGGWIAFKAADIIERVLGVPITFEEDLTIIYDEPRAALDLLPGDPLATTRALVGYFSDYLAPPRLDRFCNIAEVETVLCKTKSHWNKRYWIGKDIKEVRHGLEGWGITAKRLLKAAPDEVVEEGMLL